MEKNSIRTGDVTDDAGYCRRAFHNGGTGFARGNGLDETQIKESGDAAARMSRECETVLDLFCGSGTTGVACIRTGRKFIGIEIERKYWEIAVERCKREIKLDKSSFQIRPKPRSEPTGFFSKGNK